MLSAFSNFGWDQFDVHSSKELGFLGAKHLPFPSLTAGKGEVRGECSTKTMGIVNTKSNESELPWYKGEGRERKKSVYIE